MHPISEFFSISTIESHWLTYWNKLKHTKDACFKLHGKETVLSRMGGFRNLQSRNQARRRYTVSKLSEFSEVEINKLRSFLKTIQSGSFSKAQTCICLTSEIDASKLLIVALGLLILPHDI